MQIHVTVLAPRIGGRQDGVQRLVTRGGVYPPDKLGKEYRRAYLNAIVRGQDRASTIALGRGPPPVVRAQQDMR